MRSRKLVAIGLTLAAAGFYAASSAEPDGDLSERFSQLEAQLDEDRREETRAGNRSDGVARNVDYFSACP